MSAADFIEVTMTLIGVFLLWLLLAIGALAAVTACGLLIDEYVRDRDPSP